jgi:hypothetical protein
MVTDELSVVTVTALDVGTLTLRCPILRPILVANNDLLGWPKGSIVADVDTDAEVDVDGDSDISAGVVVVVANSLHGTVGPSACEAKVLGAASTMDRCPDGWMG